MAYNTQNRPNASNSEQKTLGFCPLAVGDRASVLYATFRSVAVVVWRPIFSQKCVINADNMLRIYVIILPDGLSESQEEFRINGWKRRGSHENKPGSDSSLPGIIVFTQTHGEEAGRYRFFILLNRCVFQFGKIHHERSILGRRLRGSKQRI